VEEHDGPELVRTLQARCEQARLDGEGGEDQEIVARQRMQRIPGAGQDDQAEERSGEDAGIRLREAEDPGLGEAGRSAASRRG
jgi:hypothetical protein